VKVAPNIHEMLRVDVPAGSIAVATDVVQR
jgi:hypothetical protein